MKVTTEMGGGYVREFKVQDTTYACTVTIGGGLGVAGWARCTCLDFWKSDTILLNVRIRYAGATIDHGCAHIDFVVREHGWTPQPYPVEPPSFKLDPSGRSY